MGEACPPDCGEGVGVVGYGFAEPAARVRAAAEALEEVDGEPVRERDEAGEVAALAGAGFAVEAFVELGD